MSEIPPEGTFVAWPEMTTALRVRAPANVKFAPMLGFCISFQHLKFQEVDARCSIPLMCRRGGWDYG